MYSQKTNVSESTLKLCFIQLVIEDVLQVLIGPLVLCDTIWLDFALLEGISDYWPVAMRWWRVSENRETVKEIMKREELEKDS